MSEIKLATAYRVDIIESEAGWGQKIDETLYFDSEQEAKDYVKDYNDKYNKQTSVPGWYMRADYVGQVQ